MRALPQRFNDFLALVLVLLCAALWVWGHLPDLVLGATVAWVGLVVQFYFRKFGGPGSDSGPSPPTS